MGGSWGGQLTPLLLAAFCMSVSENAYRVVLPYHLLQLAGGVDALQSAPLAVAQHERLKWMGAAAGVFCAGYLSSRIGSRVVCTAVFLLCGLGRAAVATLALLERSGAWADTHTLNRLRALLTMLLGGVSESQWVMMNVLVQTALLGRPAVARASGNAAYRLTNAVGSVLTPLAVTQMMAALDGWGGTYTPLLFGCAVITVTGAACLLNLELATVMLRLRAWWKDARPSRERQEVAAAYLPVLGRAPLMWLTNLVCFQTALDVTVNTYTSLSFSQAGISPQVYGAVQSTAALASIAAIAASTPVVARVGPRGFSAALCGLQALASLAIALPASQRMYGHLVVGLVVHRMCGVCIAIPSSMWTAAAASAHPPLDLGVVYSVQKVVSAVQKVGTLWVANGVAHGGWGVRGCYLACAAVYPLVAAGLWCIPTTRGTSKQHKP